MSKKKDAESSDPKYQLLDKDESSSEERRRKRKAKKKEQQKLNELKEHKSDSVNPINLNSSDIRIFKDKNQNNVETTVKEGKRKSRSLNGDEEIKSKRKRSKESKKRKSSKTNRNKLDKPKSVEKPKSSVRIIIEPQIDDIKQKRKKSEDEDIKKKKIDNELEKKKSTDSDIKKILEDEEIKKKKLEDEEFKKKKFDKEDKKKKSIDLDEKKKLNELDDFDFKKKKKLKDNEEMMEFKKKSFKDIKLNEPIVDSVKKSSADDAKKRSKENDAAKKKSKENDDLKKKSDSSFKENNELKRKNSYDDVGFNYLYQFDQLNMPNSKTSISNSKQSLPNVKSDSNKQLSQPFKQNSITELKDTQSINALERIKSKLEEQNYLKQDRPSGYDKQQKKPKPLPIDQESKSDDLIKITTKEVTRKISEETPKQASKDILTKAKPKNVYKEISSKDKLLLKSDSKKITKTKSLSNLDDMKKQNKELKKAKSDQNIPKIKIQNEKNKKEISIKATNSLKANISLGNEIKAKVGNLEEKVKGNEMVKNDKNEDDWSSISIQLDITKDPKTKKIEISEDVKILSPPKSSTVKKILPTEKLEKSDENLETKKEQLLKSKPSITHYVDKKNSNNQQQSIKQDTDKFTRYFSSSNETDTSRSEELKRIIKKQQDQKPDILEQKQQKLDRLEKQLPKKIEQQPIQDLNTINQSLDQHEAVVLYKAETDSDTQNKLKDSCLRIPKRMDILKLDKKSLDKKKIEDSSSDEQTYEQIINKRNETIKLHFPALNLSPPSCKPTPPPFHLKLQDSKPETTSLDKSEELTYHEQKKKFSLRPPAKIREDNATKSIDTSSSLELSAIRNESKRNKDYENIKKLDIPSEKKAELEKQQDLINGNKFKKEEIKDKLEIEMRKDDSESESINIDLKNLKKEIKDIIKPKIELKDKKIKEEELRDKQLKKQIEVKIDKKERQQKMNEKIRHQQTTKDEEDDELNENLRLINKFNNEIDRLRRLERYLIKVKLILIDEKCELDIKKSVIKRLILIKKDLNKLIKICDQLMDKKYLNKRKFSPLRKHKLNDERFDYSDDSNDELSSETSINLITKFNRIDKRKNEKFKEKKFKTRIKDDDYDRFLKLKKSKEHIGYKDKFSSRFNQEEEIKDNIDSDKSKYRKESIRKDEKSKKSKEQINKENDDKKTKIKISKKNNLKINNLSNQLFCSRIFKLFLILTIILTLFCSYCYYKRTRIPRRFPCRLKRKD